MTPYQYARLLASRGLHVHPNYWIVETPTEDERGNLITVRDCACPPDHDARGADGVCKSAGKHPVVPFTDAVHGSSTDAGVIDAWWLAYPEANLGVRTDGITVVDVDYRNGGLETHVWLEKQPGSPICPTFTVKTGNGFHQYYRGETTKAGGKLGKGIDFKSGPTAQVVGPGSEHMNGGTYEVMLDHDIVPPASPLVPVASDVHKSVAAQAAGTGVFAAPAGAVRKAGPGERNDFLVTKGAILRNYFDDELAFVACMQLLGARECEPPADQVRVQEIAQNLWRRDGGGDWRELLAAVDVRAGEVTDATAANTALRGIEPDRLASLLLRVKGIDDVLQQVPPAWTIDGLLPEADLAVLFGDGGTKKSFVALDWLLSSAFATSLDGAACTHWHGRKVAPGRGLYVAAEGMAGMNQRLRAWSAARQVPLDLMRRTPALGSAALGILPGSVDLRSAGAIDEAVALVDALGITYVVIDTFRRATPGADENSAKDIGEALKGAERIAMHGARVLLVHHSPAASTARARGHSSIQDDVDVVLGLKKVGKLASELFPVKLKDAEEFAPQRITFAPWPTGLTGEDGEEVRSLASVTCEPATEGALERAADGQVEALGNERKVAQALADLGPGVHLTAAQVRDVMTGAGAATSVRAVKTARETAELRGWLATEGSTRDKRWVPVQTTLAEYLATEPEA